MTINAQDQSQTHQIEVGVLDENGNCVHMFTDIDSEDYYSGSGEYVNSQNYTYCLYCGELLEDYDD